MTIRKVSVITIIDTSGSMKNKQKLMLRASQNFVSHFHPNDWIGVLQYSRQASKIFPLTKFGDDPLPVIRKANEAIHSLKGKFGGRTNITEAMELGLETIKGSKEPRGLVLLSDGGHNTGRKKPREILDSIPAGHPFYTCAIFGDDVDLDLMKTIAHRTQGKYYEVKFPSQLVKVYHDIQGQQPKTHLLVNSSKEISPLSYDEISVTVSAGSHTGQFSVYWTNNDVAYTQNEPSGNQARIYLINPDGMFLEDQPAIIEDGFVIFNVPNPAPGEWNIGIEYGGEDENLDVYCGAFELHDSSPIEMKLTAPKDIQAGEPLNFEIQVMDGNDPIENVQVKAEITRPKIGIPKALEKYSELIAKVELNEDQKQTETPEELVKLSVLYNQRLPQQDLLPTIKYPALMKRTEVGYYVSAARNTTEVGTYNIQVQVKGYSKKSGTPFQRNELVCVTVK